MAFLTHIFQCLLLFSVRFRTRSLKTNRPVTGSVEMKDTGFFPWHRADDAVSILSSLAQRRFYCTLFSMDEEENNSDVLCIHRHPFQGILLLEISISFHTKKELT